MSPLKQQLDNDFKNAFKAKSDLYPILSYIRAAIKQVEVDTRKELTDEDVINVLKKEAKKRQDSIDAYKQGGREDLAAKEQKEFEIIQKYLPQSLSEDELLSIISKIIADLKAAPSDYGKVMKEVMAQTKGRADGATVGRLVKERLK
ncbi:MAG: GatB/YqeY domain-containing protein [Parcubacteria group bacterium]|nr:GatB/YqeY domain-containing protein [Parcubacteria group bacterium]